MCVLTIICKIVLVAVNILIFLLSLAMIICGVIVVAGKDLLHDLLGSVREKLTNALMEFGVTLNTSNMSFTPFALPMAYAVIAVGVIMGSLALLGCIGGCYSFRIVLILYVVLTSTLFVAQVVTIAVVYATKGNFASNLIKPKLKETLAKYSGIEGTDAVTLAWNGIMLYIKCCGVDSHSDFDGLKQWPPKKIKNIDVDLKAPVACCKMNSTKVTDYTCAEHPTTENSYSNRGCYQSLFKLISEEKFVLITIGVLLGFQVIMIGFTSLQLLAIKSKVL